MLWPFDSGEGEAEMIANLDAKGDPNRQPFLVHIDQIGDVGLQLETSETLDPNASVLVLTCQLVTAGLPVWFVHSLHSGRDGGACRVYAPSIPLASLLLSTESPDVDVR